MGRIAPRFARVEPRYREREFALGLLSDLPRKNCWKLAEHAGNAPPDGLQHLLSRAAWHADAVRDDLRDHAIEHLQDDEAVLVVDETGDLEKGTATVGVQRQYTGTAGRIGNSQVAAHLTYSTPRGPAAIDRELYVPRSWTQDVARCQAAGIPETAHFATEPALAARMIGRALDAGVLVSWMAGDEAYGNSPHLRDASEHRQLGYVLASPATDRATRRLTRSPERSASHNFGTRLILWSLMICTDTIKRDPSDFGIKSAGRGCVANRSWNEAASFKARITTMTLPAAPEP